MTGDDAHPAVPGYDPDISAELYTTNGDTDTLHDRELRHLRLHAGDVDVRGGVGLRSPTTSGSAEDCGSGFEFPDDEALVQAEFENNIPFALAVAESAKRSRTTRFRSSAVRPPDFELDSFDVSYGDPQTVAVTAKRALKQAPAQLQDQQRQDQDRQRLRVAWRRALRPREQPLLRRVPRRGQGHPRRRPRQGLVQRREEGTAGATTTSSSPPFTYTVKRTRARRCS